MSRFTLSVWATLLLAAVAPAQEFTEPMADALVRATLGVWDVPGAAVVVVSRDRVLYLKGHGTCQLGRTQPVTPDTIFPLASCTKAFTTTLAAMLADEGKLAWDDPVRKHLPGFHLADPLADGDVRLRDLALHRTGLAPHDFLWYRSPWPLPEIVERAGRLPLAKPFRTEFQYQNVMVAALGLAAEKAGGKPWQDQLRARLFEPLGMRSATAVAPDASAPRALAHRAHRDGRLQTIEVYPQSQPNPAGSVHASARDLAAWLMFHLGDGRFGEKRLLSAGAFAELHTPQMVQKLDPLTAATHPETHLMCYAPGWVVMDYQGRPLWAHTGVIDGYRTQIALAPRDGLAIAVLSNRHETRMNLALVNNFLDRLLGLPAHDWNGYLKAVVEQDESAIRAARERRDKLRDPSGKPPRPLGDYAGAFRHPAYGEMAVRETAGRLEWSWSSFRRPLEYHHAGEFDVADVELRDPVLKFIEKDGKVTGFQMFDVEFTR